MNPNPNSLRMFNSVNVTYITMMKNLKLKKRYETLLKMSHHPEYSVFNIKF